MHSLSNKNIILGVCGGIAAYKSADLVRKFVEAGANVQVVMTTSAHKFITPTTFQALSGRPVRNTLFDDDAEAAMGHIELARWADAIIIAPATANTIASIAHGMASDLLTTLCLATQASISIAPAMNKAMWNAIATQTNVELLQQRGVAVFGPGIGEQACKEVGAGRMLEPVEIRAALAKNLAKNDQFLKGKTILITAGPTQEAIDPVRYISNHSSGKMGYAIAEKAAELGAEVTLISGPTQISSPGSIKFVSVISAEQMHDAVMSRVQKMDLFVAVAAVADYRIASMSKQKIKKSSDKLNLTPSKNPDILADVASLINNRPYCVGFAAETNNLDTYAQAKLKNKNLDMIAANLVHNDTDTVFNSDNNALEIFMRDNERISLIKASKQIIAEQLLTIIARKAF